MPTFGHQTLVDVTAFELARELIESAPDVCPAAAEPASAALQIADYVGSSPDARAEIDEQIRTKVVPSFPNYAVTRSEPS